MKRPSSCPPLSTVHSPLAEAEVLKEPRAGNTNRAAIVLLLIGLGVLLYQYKGTSESSSSQTYDAAWFKSNRNLGCTAWGEGPRILCSVSLGSRPDALNNLLANIQAVGSKVGSDASFHHLLSSSCMHVDLFTEQKLNCMSCVCVLRAVRLGDRIEDQ
jgi:hypothetical protein